ncbi:hypothetical protein ACFL35_04875 [Candidatus Riflebacteria bacterium]
MAKSRIFTFFTLFFTLFLFMQAQLQAKSFMEGFFDDVKIVKNHFPEPFEKEMARMVRLEARLVFVFRQASLYRFKSIGEESQLNLKLTEALEDLHKVLASQLKARFGDDPGKHRDKRLRHYFEKISLEGDKAAFEQFFKILAPDLQEKWQDLAEQSAKLHSSLEDPTNLEFYVRRLQKDTRFYKKVPFGKFFNKTKDKIELFLDRVTSVFCAENILRFLDKAIQNMESSSLQDLMQNMQYRLTDRLINHLANDFAGLLEDDLHGKVISEISIMSNGFLKIKMSLIKGRLRRFVKRIQKLETKRDAQLFRPLVSKVKFRIKNLAYKAKNQEAKDYLNMVCDTLQNIYIIGFLKYKSDDESAELKKLFHKVHAFLAKEDTDGLLPGIENLFNKSLEKDNLEEAQEVEFKGLSKGSIGSGFGLFLSEL